MFFHIKQAIKGKTLARSLMNQALSNITLEGKTLDLGGGSNPSYVGFIKKGEGYKRVVIDIDPEAKNRIDVDLETETLPYGEREFKNVMMLNLLEHIYNYKHVLAEAYRVVENKGSLIGFVPFLVNVHRDPHDYFRYTDEALEKMLKEAGFSNVDITTLGFGPFSVGYNTLVSVLPNKLFLIFLPLALFLDSIILTIRPNWKERFAIGYLFTATK